MITSRVKTIRNIFIISLALLLIRLAYIAIYKNQEYTHASSMQRTVLLPISTSPRGLIYDRNMFPLTARTTSLYAIIDPSVATSNRSSDLATAERLLGIPLQPQGIQVAPVSLNLADQQTLFSLPGIMPVNLANHGIEHLSTEAADRRSEEFATHLIGYINSDSIGTGLEKAFNDFLEVETAGLVVETSANHQSISGLGVQMLGRTRKGIQTTLDYRIQSITQEILSQNVPNGAAIVMEAQTGNILAMASTPTYSRFNIADSLSDENNVLMNRAITAYDVGSIFKIVTAAAALETGTATAQSSFHCEGHIDILNRNFFCNNLGGHGPQSFSSAFAYSCNIPFYEIGTTLGTRVINDYARRFGLNSLVLDGILPEEQIGGLARGEDIYQTANMSIGQAELQATPLQIAQMVSVIANNGRLVPVRLVKNIVADDGTTLTPYSSGADHRFTAKQVIRPQTAETIRRMMVEAVEYGTGRNAQIEGISSAGKTASAETGWLYDVIDPESAEQRSETKTHGWFGGFFPADNPEYIIVIFAENGRSGSASAAPSFREIGEQILQLLP